MSSERAAPRGERKPFRAVDVLSGSIDRGTRSAPERRRKQISAQLEPSQVRLLGELHARLNASSRERIEKSELVGLAIELLADALEPGDAEQAFRDVADVRSYLRTYVRGKQP